MQAQKRAVGSSPEKHFGENVQPSDDTTTQDLITLQTGKAMVSTIAIAEGIGVTNPALIKTIRKYQSEFNELGLLRFEIGAKATDNTKAKSKTYALLNEAQVTFLLTLSKNTAKVVAFKLRLTKAFIQLSPIDQPSIIPQTRVEALRLAADLEEENEQMRPKAEGFERIAISDGAMCIRYAAKPLQMRPKDLTGWLNANGWIYRNKTSGAWTGNQTKIHAGYLEHKITTVKLPDGSLKAVDQVRILPKGLAKLAMELGKRC